MIDINKEVTTRDGRRVTLWSVDGPSQFPIVGYVVGKEFEQVLSWTKSGKYGGNHHSFDLVQSPDAPLSEFGRKRALVEAADEMVEALGALVDAGAVLHGGPITGDLPVTVSLTICQFLKMCDLVRKARGSK